MKKTLQQMLDPKIFSLYDDYAHSRIDRRTFLDGLSAFAIGGITVSALLDYLMPDYATKIQVLQDDPRLRSEMIQYPSPKGGGSINGLLSRPSDDKGDLPGIIVVHENRGLNPHIMDVSRRAALPGFISIAPDALSPLGGYPGSDDEGRTLQRKRDRQEMLEDFIAAYDYLKNHPECNGEIGVVGFCFGGWISNMMAVRITDLGAAVPFYGGQPDPEDVAGINAPLLLHYAELDERVNKGWPAYEAKLKEHGKEYSAHIYSGVNHGFHNDTTPRYNQEAAELAWQRTIEFFRKKLN